MNPGEGTRTPPVICLDIGGTSVRAAAVRLGAEPSVEHRLRTPTLAHQGGAALLDRALRLAVRVHQQVPEAVGVAVASAGVIGPETGSVTSATELIPGWGGTPISQTMTRQLRLPCTVLNDVHAHGLGEFRFGQGAGSASALIVAVGTGLGGALISGGKLLRGSSGQAGHIGHIHHGAAAGLRCSCGRVGHLEAVASGSAMAQRYSELKEPHDPLAADGAAVADHCAAGVASAEQVVRTAAAALGESLGSLANTWDPERIVLTGSVTEAGTQWWQQVRQWYQVSAMDSLQDRPLQQGALGDDAPLLGAAAHHYQNQKNRLS